MLQASLGVLVDDIGWPESSLGPQYLMYVYLDTLV